MATRSGKTRRLTRPCSHRVTAGTAVREAYQIISRAGADVAGPDLFLDSLADLLPPLALD